MMNIMDKQAKRVAVGGAALAVGAVVAFTASVSFGGGPRGASLEPSGTGAPAGAAATSRPDDSLRAHLGPDVSWEAVELDQERLREAARIGWAYVDAHYQPSTGLVKATSAWDPITTWDLGSVLAAYHSAHGLGLLDEAGFRERMGRVLATLGSMPLHEDAAFSRAYSAARATAVDGEGTTIAGGNGWSTTDLGRLLIWLKIVAEQHPDFADEAEAVAARLDYGRLVRDGSLWGRDARQREGHRDYPEGRIGYEQYAARGFELWGHPAPAALDWFRHAAPVEVLGEPLLGDVRGRDRLTSEPFVLMGLETGWDPDGRLLAHRVLAAQRARWQQTGQMTMVSEDAVDRPPAYFYYYNVYRDGDAFVVDAQIPLKPGQAPRWISAKAALGWYALIPSSFTRAALDAVDPAGDPNRGWASGVYEDSEESTRTYNLNSAAVALEAALYAQRGTPLLQRR